MHSFLPLLPNPPRPKSRPHLKMFSRAGHHLVLRENLGERFHYLVKRRRREQCNMLCMFLHSRCSAFRTIRAVILGSHVHRHTYTHFISFFHPRPNVPSPRMRPHITNLASINAEQHSIKSPTGPARAPFGP